MRRAILLVLCLLLLCPVADARRIAWQPTKKPPVSLAEAIKLAEAALQNETLQYFCIGASLAKTFSQGDWELHFSSEEGKQLFVSVGSDKKVQKSVSGFEY